MKNWSKKWIAWGLTLILMAQCCVSFADSIPNLYDPIPIVMKLIYGVTVSAEPEVGGTVTGEGQYEANSSATVTATANKGYAFVRWEEFDSQVSTDANYSFTVTSRRALKAVFMKTCTVIWLNGDGGELDRKEYILRYENEPVTDRQPVKAADADYTYTFSGWESGEWGEGADGTATVTYTPLFTAVPIPEHTLTISYVYADGGAAASSHTETLKEGAEFAVDSPVIEGYTVDQTSVSGTMGAANVTETVTYTKADPLPPSAQDVKQENDPPVDIPVTITDPVFPTEFLRHTLVIRYVFEDLSPAADTYMETFLEGFEYSVASPSVKGYKADIKTVSGKMGTEDISVTVTYSKEQQKQKTKIIAKNISYFYSKNKPLNVSLKTASGKPVKNAKLTLKANKKTYTKKTNKKGIATFKLSLQPGKYTAKIKYSGNKNYSASSKTIKIQVKKSQKPQIIAKDLTYYSWTNKKFTVTLTNASGKPLKNEKLTLKINGKTYRKKTNAEGKVAFSVKLKPGTYKADIQYAGNNQYQKTGKTIKITVKNSIVAKNTTVKYKKGQSVTCRVFAVNGKPKANTAIKFKFNGKTYSKKTDKNGTVSFKIPKSTKPGTYKGTFYSYDSTTTSIKITVKK